MPVLVDSCVILDVFTEDDRWCRWSCEMLAEQLDRTTLVINPIIYSEISIRFRRIEELEEVLSFGMFDYRPIPREAAFLAGKAFRHYRQEGGDKKTPLPDFFIGAHAAVEGLPLLTRDVGRFQYYFPTVELIRP